MTETRHNCIYQKRPANLTHERWKDATPLGNGETGALVFGDIGKERIRFTRADLWDGCENSNLPDVSTTLEKVRNFMDCGDYPAANELSANALSENGYHPDMALPFPIGDLTIAFSYADDRFTSYRRILHLDTASCEIRYRMGENSVTRTSFISRVDGLFYCRIRSNTPISLTALTGLPDVGSHRDIPHELTVRGDMLIFTRNGAQEGCGMLCRTGETDGTVTVGTEGIRVENLTALTIALKTTASGDDRDVFPFTDYETAFRANAEAYGALYSRAGITLSDDDDDMPDKSNEEYLLDVFSGDCDIRKESAALYEKLWRFGRYLFISGIGKYPFPLYGLWAGDYFLPWAQHVANENVQIIHWNALAGNLPELIRPLIRYFYEKIPHFRENAKALFGCRGILVSAYSTPIDGHINPPVPVILNFTMASGWLCHHFFDYYAMTADEETLLGEILPFACETARFIEDFAVIRDGKLLWYPSVSPENTPRSFVDPANPMGHAMPTTKNASIELAIIKEMLTRLCAVCESHGLYGEKIGIWKNILRAIPPYRINQDGAVKEWQTDEFDDQYCHRHLSHLYPVFPGNEVTRESDPVLWKAFEKAVDLRELGGQSGWSFAHMAGIYARLGRGEDMIGCLDYLCRSCLYDNFFTVHNDWRENHLTLEMNNPPVQLDALMGVVNVLQQMLLDDDGKTLHLFGALPKIFDRGSAEGLAFRFGTAALRWNAEKKLYAAEITAVRDGTIRIDCPKHPLDGSYTVIDLLLEKGRTYTLNFD